MSIVSVNSNISFIYIREVDESCFLPLTITEQYEVNNREWFNQK